MRRSATKALVIGALVGLFVPVVCLWTTFLFHWGPGAWDWIIYIWPSSFMAMAISNSAAWSSQNEVLALSIGVNMLLYSLAALIVRTVFAFFLAGRGLSGVFLRFDIINATSRPVIASYCCG
jgi:hypothetical protein